jgi:exonuclease III
MAGRSATGTTTKLAFIDALADRARRWLAGDHRLVVAGDVNIARPTATCSIPTRSSARSTSPGRSDAPCLLDAGLVDVDVAAGCPAAGSWWDHGIG